MATRLSDLLERIRPAGAPGAATETTTQRERDAATEVAGVAAAIADAEQAAAEVVARARRAAADVVQEGEQQARQIRADLPDRVAAEGAAIATQGPQGDDAEARLAVETDQRIAALRADAGRARPALVTQAVAAVWDERATDRP